MSFQLVIMSMVDRLIGSIGEVIVAGAVAATALVVLDLGQIISLQLILGTDRLSRSTMGWIGRTGRAQLLWGLAAVITIEIVLIQPWFLLPAVPLFLLGYLDIRARFIAERRARLLATLVEVGHAVGASLDPNEVFRNVYRQVAAVMDADNFFVATLGPEVSAVYIDKGGDTLDFAFTTGQTPSDLLSLPKIAPAVSRVLETGMPVAFSRRADAPEYTRKLLERFGHEALLVHPLRSADQTI